MFSCRLVVFAVLVSSFAFSQPAKKYRVWVDGIYDMAHYGHQRSFEKARKAAAEHFKVEPEAIEIVVGVCGGDIKSYKREPVMSLEQRAAQVRSFKGVDEVVEGSGLTFGLEDAEHHQIDLTMHGNDYTEKQIVDYYPGLLEAGKFKTYPYEPGISTTQITKRATKLTLESLLEKETVDCVEKEAVRQVLEILKQGRI